ncbi:MAG: L,D-transpeptidase family protein, partial [Alphaproteobacteria bacterium]
PEFDAIRRRLAEVRASSKERPPFIPAGRFMQLGKTDPRVVTLRERLGLSAAVEDPELFDDIVDEAVRAYQEQADLNVDGIVGPGTLGVLNRDAEDHAATILVNMERWRWMPKDLGRLYVRVNVPNYNVEIHRDGEVFHSTRIVVGKPRNQTPIFSDEIEHVIVNPTWNVPASIARKEFLPAMLQNSSALNGYNVYANIKGHFRQVDPLKVNWSSVDMRKIQIKQPPGARNALGRVKFMFPNKHAVYLHDTPSKSLFKKDVRAFSHGCVRVNNPWDFAEALLDADPNLTGEIVQKMVGGREKQLNLDEHIPVHITYFTAWIDADSELQIRRDLYGHDTRMKKALGLI